MKRKNKKGKKYSIFTIFAAIYSRFDVGVVLDH